MFGLDGFPGDVIVEKCKFENNLFRYTSCLDMDLREEPSTGLLERVSY